MRMMISFRLIFSASALVQDLSGPSSLLELVYSEFHMPDLVSSRNVASVCKEIHPQDVWLRLPIHRATLFHTTVCLEVVN